MVLCRWKIEGEKAINFLAQKYVTRVSGSNLVRILENEEYPLLLSETAPNLVETNFISSILYCNDKILVFFIIHRLLETILRRGGGMGCGAKARFLFSL